MRRIGHFLSDAWRLAGPYWRSEERWRARLLLGVVVVLNLTPIPRENYYIGVPAAGTYRELLSTDESRFGGTGMHRVPVAETQSSALHGYPQSIGLSLPPLGAVVYRHEAAPTAARPNVQLVE